MLRLALVVLGMWATHVAAQGVDTLAQRVRPCVACHGSEGRATRVGYFPRIAGKPAGYLYAQLLNFRAGRRVNTSMTVLLDPLSDAYLKEIAGYFAALDLPYPPPPPLPLSAADQARGETLVRRGDVDQHLPACMQCHGHAMTGVLPAIPGLLGLPRDYLVAQLGAWRTGNRKATAPDCMAQVATQLSPADIGAVADWLSSQPVPPDAKPAAGVPQPLPLPCGGLDP